jgi:hypothetical protein
MKGHFCLGLISGTGALGPHRIGDPGRIDAGQAPSGVLDSTLRQALTAPLGRAPKLPITVQCRDLVSGNLERQPRT